MLDNHKEDALRGASFFVFMGTAFWVLVQAVANRRACLDMIVLTGMDRNQKVILLTLLGQEVLVLQQLELSGLAGPCRVALALVLRVG